MTILEPIVDEIMWPVMMPILGPEGPGGLPGPPGPPGPPSNTMFFFGQLSESVAANVVVGFLPNFVPSVGTNARFTITGLVPGNYLWLVSPTGIEIDELQQIVGGSPQGNVISNWTKTEDALSLPGGTSDTYRRGPIDASAVGQSIQYEASFVAGS